MTHPRDIWNFSDPAASEVAFRDLADQSSDEEEQRVWQTQVARALGLQRKFDEAHAVLDGLPKVEAATSRWTTYALLERGRILNSSGNADKARPFFDLAAKSLDDDLRIDAIHMQAIVAEGAAALELNETAIREAQESPDPYAKLWLGSLLNNTAWTHHDLGNFDRALELFREALAFREENGSPEPIRIAKWSVGRCLRSFGRFQEALDLQLDLATQTEDGYVSEEIGECLQSLNRPEEAKPHFAEAYRLLSQDDWLKKNEASRLERLKLLGS